MTIPCEYHGERFASCSNVCRPPDPLSIEERNGSAPDSFEDDIDEDLEAHPFEVIDTAIFDARTDLFHVAPGDPLGLQAILAEEAAALEEPEPVRFSHLEWAQAYDAAILWAPGEVTCDDYVSDLHAVTVGEVAIEGTLDELETFFSSALNAVYAAQQAARRPVLPLGPLRPRLRHGVEVPKTTTDLY